MLRATGTGAQVVVCSTCRHPGGARDDAHGRQGGALLADRLRQARAGDPAFAGIAIEAMACLFACSQPCVVHIRESGKLGYVLGGFAPDAGAALAIMTYAAAHARSAHGEVAYDQWPDGVKGHFIVRIPPQGAVLA